jgi:predicted O-linked N-acetylglucosamine transferase (SPINDLY family)
METYLALYHQVDLCLDTYPYNGGTTSIHGVWMGVPTLTVAGRTPAARAGAAILSQVGLQGFTAVNTREFIAQGVHWAGHLDALAQIRAGLRRRLQESPSRRADIIAVALAAALRRMWRRWCAGLPAESFNSATSNLSA